MTAENRERFKSAMEEIGLAVPAAGFAHSLEEALAVGSVDRLPGDGAPELHPRRRRHRDRARRGPPGPTRRGSAVCVAGHRGPRRAVHRRPEGIRARGDARQRGQLRGHLLDRERRPDGCPHRRLDHRRTRTDPDRRRVPDDARRLFRLHPAGRGRDRRLQRAVRGGPGRRSPDDHRDEPARSRDPPHSRRRPPGSRSRRSRPVSRSATGSTRSKTTSPVRRRPPSSRPSTTW